MDGRIEKLGSQPWWWKGAGEAGSFRKTAR